MATIIVAKLFILDDCRIPGQASVITSNQIVPIKLLLFWYILTHFPYIFAIFDLWNSLQYSHTICMQTGVYFSEFPTAFQLSVKKCQRDKLHLMIIKYFLVFGNDFYIFFKNSKFLYGFHNEWSPSNVYLFKVRNRKTRNRCEICSELTIKISKRCQWHRSIVFFLDFEYSTPCYSVSILNFEQVIAG